MQIPDKDGRVVQTEVGLLSIAASVGGSDQRREAELSIGVIISLKANAG
jgi:hypothetical protein